MADVPPAPKPLAMESLVVTCSRLWSFLPIGGLCLALSIQLGCDANSGPGARVPPPGAKKPTINLPVAPRKATVSFASVDAGIAAFRAACVERNADQISETSRWLLEQGSSAAAPLTAILADENGDPGTRIATCRLLLLMGPENAPAILSAADSKVTAVRLKAAESLGSIKPSSTPIVDKLLVLVDDEDHKVRVNAIKSLGRIGPQAKRAAPRMQEILNSNAHEELRAEAHRTLKKINPRVGFTQGELDE